MNFIFEWQHSILGTSAVLFLPRENKVHIFKPPCNVLFFEKKNSLQRLSEEKNCMQHKYNRNLMGKKISCPPDC